MAECAITLVFTRLILIFSMVCLFSACQSTRTVVDQTLPAMPLEPWPEGIPELIPPEVGPQSVQEPTTEQEDPDIATTVPAVESNEEPADRGESGQDVSKAPEAVEPPVLESVPDAVGSVEKQVSETVNEVGTTEPLPVPEVSEVDEPEEDLQIETPALTQQSSSPTVKVSIPKDAKRPEHLVPGPVPFKINYQSVSDVEVLEAAEVLQAFLEGRVEPSNCSSDLLTVYDGAWGLIRGRPSIKATGMGDNYVILSPNGKAFEVEGAMAYEPEKIIAALSELRSIIGADAHIRAMQTLEMAEWWSYTGFDIKEPVFVVESKRDSKQYLFFFQQNKISVVDELSALPDVL